MDNRKIHFGTHIGTASILLTFMVLCLVSFAVLTYANAASDLKLSNKLSKRQDDYILACNTASADLASLDTSVREAISQTGSSSIDRIYTQNGGQYQTFTYPIDDTQNLVVEIKLMEPSKNDEKAIKILRWQSQTIASDEILDESLPVFGSN